MKPYLFVFCLLLLGSGPMIRAQSIGTWTNTGPFQTAVNAVPGLPLGEPLGIGRISQIKFHPSNSQKMYAVSATGGLFISNNNAQSWSHTGTDALLGIHTSCICIDPTNDQVLYLGTGDPNYYSQGYGVWKSLDGGTTWNSSYSGMGYLLVLEILIDPTNHNTLLAATNNGLYKSTNAGSSWSQQLQGSFTDMKQKTGTGTSVYAVTNDQFWKSSDFGTTWAQVTNGFSIPSGNTGLRIAVSAADTNRVYVATTYSNGVILKSTNGAQSFSTVYNSSSQCLVCYLPAPSSGSQGNYNLTLTANPLNADEVLIASHRIWRSVDGGITWTQRTAIGEPHAMHTDMHDMKYNPYNNQQVVNANDGGIWFNMDSLYSNWTPRNNGLAVMELYHGAQCPTDRQIVDMGTQDNGKVYYDNVWKYIGGGDWFGKSSFDYRGLGTSYFFDIGFRRNLKPLGFGLGYNQPCYNCEIAFVPSMHEVAFTGDDTLFRTSNLSSNAPSWTKLNAFPSGIKFMESCKADSNILYVMLFTGDLYRSDNILSNNPSFSLLTLPAVPYFSNIATNRNNKGIVYLSINDKLYRSQDKGVSWSDITGNLPPLNINIVLHDDYSVNERLFTSLGNYIYYKSGSTTNWTQINGLPSICNVTDLMLYNDGTAASTLRVSTFGRGLWECAINNNLPPVGDFWADKQEICHGLTGGDTVHFNKNIYGNATSFSWSFPGGVPSSSTADSPVIVYPSLGIYPVSLTTTGAAGTHTTTKSNFITVAYGQGVNTQEGFENPSFPPQDWQVVPSSGNTNSSWMVGPPGGFGQSTISVSIDNWHNDFHGGHDKLITPRVDTRNATSAYVTFDLAYEQYIGASDSLLISISTDCGQTFQLVYTKWGSSLSTTSAINTYLYPAASEWRKDSIDLSTYIGSGIQLSFDNVGHNGNMLYLDNINLQVVKPLKVESTNQLHLDVYPNPTSGMVSVRGRLHTGNATITCYDMVGRQVLQKEVTPKNGLFTEQIDLSYNAPGIYLIMIQNRDGDKQYRKILLK